MSRKPDRPVSPYPAGFVFGRGEADPNAWSLSGLKISRALRALRKVKAGAVLELGCGGGQYLRALRRHRPDLNLAAVDLDSAAVDCARRIPEADCRLADAGRLPFPDGTFQAVLGFDILEHVPEPDRVLSEAARVLAPGGIFHLYVPCEGNPGTVYARKGHAFKAKWGGHCQAFTTKDLLARLAGRGFEIETVRHADYPLTQWFDYAFFKRLEQSRHPEILWAAQALVPGGGGKGRVLRAARVCLSALSWLEGSLRRGSRSAMGLHVTARKPG